MCVHQCWGGAYVRVDAWVWMCVGVSACMNMGVSVHVCEHECGRVQRCVHAYLALGRSCAAGSVPRPAHVPLCQIF